jgi:hypothetical protein
MRRTQNSQAYSDALVKAKRMEKQRSIIEKTGKVGSAFKTILDFGRMVAEVSLVMHLTLVLYN